MKSEVIVTENELPSVVIDAIRGGRKIEAIQLLQESTGLGMANAKVLVDRAWRTHGPKKPLPNFSDQSPGLSILVKSLLMVFVAVAAYYFYSSA